jgi:methylated-DNA-[protein]-cysteine S-methyltransferase
MQSVFFYEFPVSGIGIAEDAGEICGVFFSGKKGGGDGGPFAAFARRETPLIKRAAKQLGEYFEGKRKSFDLPLAPHGTDFQVSVWKALRSIPFGQKRSYKEVAAMLGKPGAARAVGMANNRNPVAIMIPCHRVVGSDGSLTGYAAGLPVKKFLLDREKRFS